jgi:hypothetical protein
MEKELELEVKKYMTSGRFESPDGHGMNEVKLGFIDGAKWQAKRMYSEEEVLELLNKREDYINSEDNIFEYQSNKEWLEQFKKK